MTFKHFVAAIQQEQNLNMEDQLLEPGSLHHRLQVVVLSQSAHLLELLEAQHLQQFLQDGRATHLHLHIVILGKDIQMEFIHIKSLELDQHFHPLYLKILPPWHGKLF